MTNDTIYVWENGYWMWAMNYTILAHKSLGQYKEFVIGLGFQDFEVDEMVSQYLHDLWNEDDD